MQKSARARLSDVMSTPEKSTLPSAPLRSHRNFEFSFWNYMSTMLMWTIQNSVARARLSSVWSTIERSTRPSAPLKSHRNFEFSFWEYMSPILLLAMQNSVARARLSSALSTIECAGAVACKSAPVRRRPGAAQIDAWMDATGEAKPRVRRRLGWGRQINRDCADASVRRRPGGYAQIDGCAAPAKQNRRRGGERSLKINQNGDQDMGGPPSLDTRVAP